MMKWIDRAEVRFGHIAIPHLVQGIGLFSAAVFILYKSNPGFLSAIELYPDRVLAGEVWRLATYIFVPSMCSFLMPFPDWVNAAFYVVFMLWIGNGLEHVWGAFKVTLYCLITMAGITVAAFFFGTLFSHFILVQAFFFAFARYYPDEVITLSFVLPVKVKWLAWADGAWLLWQLTFGGNSFRMGALAAFSAYLIFFGGEIFESARHRQQVVSRKRRFEKEQVSGDDALHRCEVCGRTEHDAPDVDFRVSRDGHEYCQEHLPKTVPAVLPGQPGAG